MSRRVKVAVTGLGVSRSMLHWYRDSADTELALLHDVDEARLREVAAKFPEARATSDWDEVLAGDAEMVDVSTPNHIHPRQAISALEAGKHVLCQKPMAPTVADCRSMCDAARRAGKTLGMLMVMHGVPLYRSLKAMYEKGLFGKIASVHIRNAHRGPLTKRADKNHWRAKAENVGGGSFMQLGVHNLNLVQWLLNDEIVRVCGFADNLHCRHSLDGEDVAAGAGEFRGGAKLTMQSGYSSIGNMTAVYGTEGHFVMSRDGDLTLEANAPFEDEILSYPGPDARPGEAVSIRGEASKQRTQTPADYPHVQQLAFARAVRDGRPAPVPGEVGLRDVAIIQALYRAAAEKRYVEVDELLR
ncbi:MAG: Gfo/Idh/MocA family oxidoreductase [Planctomycetota bacterium]|nr:Gfo/Idh/MocA family oxidoreductase [Planctomycetota bacterium]